MTETQTIEQIVTDTPTRLQEPGDHERLSHYVPKEQLEAAILNGTPCIALCGKVWTPTRDAKSFPVCGQCKEIFEGLEDDIDPESQG